MEHTSNRNIRPNLTPYITSNGQTQNDQIYIRATGTYGQTQTPYITVLGKLKTTNRINSLEHTVVLEFYLRLVGEIFSFVDRSRQQHQSKKVQLRPHPNGHQNVILCFLGCALGLFLPVNQRNTEAYLHKKIPRC